MSKNDGGPARTVDDLMAVIGPHLDTMAGGEDKIRTALAAALAAEYERGRGEREQDADEIERLRAERDALRADALRYRWLRDSHPADGTLWVAFDIPPRVRSRRLESLDAAIDAAMASQTTETAPEDSP